MNRLFSRKCLFLLLLAPAALQACATESSLRREAAETEVRDKAVFLCQHDLLLTPDPSRFPPGARLADNLRQEDIFFLRDNPRWFSVGPTPPAPKPSSCEVTSMEW